LAVLRDVENETSAPARVATSDEIAVLNTESTATSDTDADESVLETPATAAARTLTSDANTVATELFANVMVDAVAEIDADTDPADAFNATTSPLNTVLMLASADVSATTDELSAVETDVSALVRLITSAESALEVAVTSAITLAICVKLGLVFNSFAISASVSRAVGALPFRVDIATLNALVAVDFSAESEVERLDATVASDGSARPIIPDETDCTWLLRTDTSVEMTFPSEVFAFIMELSAPLAETENELVWLICTDFSVEIAVLRLAFADINPDTARLVPADKAATDELSAVDSATNAPDTPK
jgi:hypothetical protein